MADDASLRTDDTQNEGVIELTRLVKEWKRTALLVDKKKNANIAGTEVQSKLNHLRCQYKELKQSTCYQQTLLFLLQELSLGDVGSPHDETELEAKKTTPAEGEQSPKDELQDAKTHVEELADMAETHYAEYQSMLEQLEERIGTAERKSARIAQKREEVQRRLAALGRNNVETSTTKKMDDCKPMQEILDGVLIAIATSESHLKTLKADCRQTKMEADEVCRFLQVLRSFESATKGLTLAQIVWCVQLHGYLQTLGGIRETHVTGTDVTLEFFHPPSPHEPPLCTLNIKFSLTKFASYKLESAEVKPTTLDVTDVIRAAVHSNDVRLLITHVQAACNRHAYLLPEIEKLREKFALDWLPKENVLTVLFGHDASAVVRLHIDPGYPTNGDVTILSAGGLPEGITVSQLRLPCSGGHSLTDYVDHLGQKLQLCFPVQRAIH